MKITIDTKNDTREEIRKTIEFLQTLVSAQAYQQSNFSPASESNNAFGAMFGSNSSASSSPTQSSNESSDYINPLAGTSPPANQPSMRTTETEEEKPKRTGFSLQTY